MARKVTVEVKLRLTINAEEGDDFSEILNEFVADLSGTNIGHGIAELEDVELLEQNITDSR